MALNYDGALVLAPMVRVGTLPMRLLAARYGASIVYSEELIDKKLMHTERQLNERLGTVDFIEKRSGQVVFRTLEEERSRVVLQLGTAGSATALAAAQVVCKDVATIDINCGCPKAFSLQGGMGAALLRKPEVVEDIIKTLRRNLDLPVTCKIRLLDESRDTVELARRFAACGIAALAVHGRTVQQRPRDAASWEGIRDVVAALPDLPVVANGDVMSYADVQRVRTDTGCAAAMVARAAMWNCSVFREEGFLPLADVQRDYARVGAQYGAHIANVKYVLKEMTNAPPAFAGRRGGGLVGHDGNTAITKARDWAALFGLLGINDLPPPVEDKVRGKGGTGAQDAGKGGAKRKREEDGEEPGEAAGGQD